MQPTARWKKIDPKSSHHLKPLRTPLQLAASIGNLTLVKLFIECYQCDDSLVAPDGQLALRLAAEGGHREIVQYLPLRRGGGWRRWKIHHAKAWKTITKASRKIRSFFKILMKDIPKFLLWDFPKDLIIRPIINGSKWCWRNRKGFWPWLIRSIRAFPQVIADAAKSMWKFSTKTLPGLLTSLFWVRLPKATIIILKWIWDGLSLTGIFFTRTILQAISFLDTVFGAITTYFHNANWKDIWNSFYILFHILFIAFPKQLWAWLAKFGEKSCDFMAVMFGVTGEVIWFIAYSLCSLVIYVPRKLWTIARSFGGSVSKAGYEICIWVNPKG